MNTHQPSVILGINPTRNARKWDTANACATLERVSSPIVEGEQRKRTEKLHSFEIADGLDDDSLIGSLEINILKRAVGDVLWVTQEVNDQTLKMELETGSAVSTLHVQKCEEMFPNIPLVTTEAHLKTYSGERIAPEGKLHVRVEYSNKVKDFTLHLVKFGGLHGLEEIGYTRSNSTGNSTVLLLKGSQPKTSGGS